uniref:Uncharacterized protein n=1 Tax=Nelumbo nucifera TaxID=4432 RepID=A0A822Y3N5_NELNU|nr:TPA_asm: hypothetical protein HUJ06_027679 [Nelumbo nucifera]
MLVGLMRKTEQIQRSFTAIKDVRTGFSLTEAEPPPVDSSVSLFVMCRAVNLINNWIETCYCCSDPII